MRECDKVYSYHCLENSLKHISVCFVDAVTDSSSLWSVWISGDKCDDVVGLSRLGGPTEGNLTVGGTGPANATIGVGETAVFTCTTASSDNVEWLIDCVSATAFGGKVTIAGTQLAIASVTPSQSGTMVTCYVNSTSGVLFRGSAYLTVKCELIAVTKGRQV